MPSMHACLGAVSAAVTDAVAAAGSAAHTAAAGAIAAARLREDRATLEAGRTAAALQAVRMDAEQCVVAWRRIVVRFGGGRAGC